MDLEHFETICRLITASDQQGLLVRPHGLSGFSGEKLIGLLQRLADYEARLDGACYLEIGVFQGLSLISTARAVGDVGVFGIDNFSQFDKHGENLQIVQQRMSANGVTNATVINMDYEDALETLSSLLKGSRVGTFFVDGPHDYRSQLVCLQLIKPHLSDGAVIVVDDCNYRHVRLANRDFLLANSEFKLIFESYTPSHPDNMTQEDRRRVTQGWWNGVNVIVKDLENRLQPQYPPTLRDRTLFQNDHMVHSAKYAVLAPESVALVSSLAALSPVGVAKSLVKLFRTAIHVNRQLVGRYLAANTFSENLPQSRFNPTCDPS